MNASAPLLVAVNAGSSSLKVAAYGATGDGPALFRGRQDGNASPWLLQWLEANVGNRECLIGHRIVASRPCPPVEEVTPTLLNELQRATIDDPIHLPVQLALIDAIASARPGARQFACSDSAFHSTIPPAGRHLPLPRAFDELGIMRIGFHGLSCTSVVGQLRDAFGDAVADGRLIIAHLGSGASVTAVQHGESRDTSMGFSPEGGVMMASRPGDLDPGAILAILRRAKLTTGELSHLIASESGLRGRTGDTGDLRLLLEREATDPAAAEAIEMFCRSVARSIAGAATTIGGIDTLVFAGGVGEHLPRIRSRICSALDFLGVTPDPAANAANSQRISLPASAVALFVIAVDEEAVIARLVRERVNGAP